MTPLGRESAEIVAQALAEVKRRHGEHGRVEAGILGLDDLGGGLPLLASVEAGEVEVVPVESDLAPEVRTVAEGFAVEELVFLEAVDGFDVALPGAGAGRDVVVAGAQGSHQAGQAGRLQGGCDAGCQACRRA